MFSTPNQDTDVIVEFSCEARVALFNGKPGDSLPAMKYSTLCKKVSAAKSFVTPDRLPPTSSATKYHALRCYHQVMQWIDRDTIVDPTYWRWNSNNNNLDHVLMDRPPTLEALLKMTTTIAPVAAAHFGIHAENMDFTLHKHADHAMPRWPM